MSDHNLAVTLPAGRSVALVLPFHQSGEVAVAGVERLRVPLEFFLNAFREIPTFKRGQQLLMIHEFSDPPRLQDLQSLILPPAEIQALSECAPGSCGVKLSTSMMDHFRGKGVDIASGERLCRDLMIQYVTQYLEKGNPAMLTYADTVPAIRSWDEFRVLLQEVDWLSEAAPPLYNCLESFSGKACPQIESSIYWSNARFGLKPVFSITHLMIYRQWAGRPWAFIAFKQIYADHYFDTSLGLALLVEQSAGPANPVLWVLYLNGSRVDALKGWLGPLKAAIVTRRSVGAMRRNLRDLKGDLEKQYSRSVEPFRR